MLRSCHLLLVALAFSVEHCIIQRLDEKYSGDCREGIERFSGKDTSLDLKDLG